MSEARMTRTVLALVAVALATVAAWVALRSLETAEADDRDRAAAVERARALRSEVVDVVGAVETVAATLAPDPGEELPVERFGRTLVATGLATSTSAVTEAAVVDPGVTSLDVLAVAGVPDPGAVVGRSVTLDPNGEELLGGSGPEASVAVPSVELTSVAESLFGESPPGAILVTPVTERGTDVVRALVVARIQFGPILATDGLGALHLGLESVSVASSPDHDPTGPAIDPPVEFTAAGAAWRVDANPVGPAPSHRGSWILLVGGLAVAGTAAAFVWALQRWGRTRRRLAEIEYDALHDDLTRLTNRKGLTEDLAARLADRRTNNLVGVLLLDLDRLKVVNDSIGHSAGDEVLAAVAQRLLGAVREEDTVGRFGGDEFIVVSSGVPSVRDLTILADRILDALKPPAILSDESSQMISASIGIAYVAAGEADAETLLRDADVAMYKAKEQGGSRYVVFDAELREQAVARLEVERELRRAIRTGQLSVHYQPIVDAADGRVDRLEALVRWEHPTRGLMSPGTFLSVAAESGLIVDVGEHVLRESCRQAAAWTAAVGEPVMVSVNVAERQLIDQGLFELVQRVLAETGLDPSQLELELSEEIIVERIDSRLEILHQIVDLGVKLAIDDFGTSRASLSMLKRLDMVSTLKIDRAFVTDVADDPVDRKIVTAIVALAESIGMETIAEGVEDAEQVAVLRSLGIRRFQGFYFHRPAPGSQVLPVLTRPFEIPSPADSLV